MFQKNSKNLCTNDEDKNVTSKRENRDTSKADRVLEGRSRRWDQVRDGFLRRLKHNRLAAPDNDPHRSGSQNPSVVVNARTHTRMYIARCDAERVQRSREEERTRAARSFREMERDGSGDFNLAPRWNKVDIWGRWRRVRSWDHPESHLARLSGGGD